MVETAHRVRREAAYGSFRHLCNTTLFGVYKTSDKRTAIGEEGRMLVRQQRVIASPIPGRRLHIGARGVRARDQRPPWCPMNQPGPTERARNGRRSRKERKNKSLTRGHVENIGSTLGIQSYGGAGLRRGNVRGVSCDLPAPPSLRNGGALRGARRARPMIVCGGPLLMGCPFVRWGCNRICSVMSNSGG
jgi:hypothetical protein